MIHLRTLILFAIVLILAGCTAEYTKSLAERSLEHAYIIDTSTVHTERQWVLSSRARLYVAFPEGNWSVPLRRKLTSDLAVSLNQVFANTGNADDPQSLPHALDAGHHHGAQFLIYPQLAVYSNKLSSYVEIDEDFEDYRQIGLDRAVLLLKLFDIHSGKLLDITKLEMRSGWLTLERATPSDLFEDAFLAYADSLVPKPIK